MQTLSKLIVIGACTACTSVEPTYPYQVIDLSGRTTDVRNPEFPGPQPRIVPRASEPQLAEDLFDRLVRPIKELYGLDELSFREGSATAVTSDSVAGNIDDSPYRTWRWHQGQHTAFALRRIDGELLDHWVVDMNEDDVMVGSYGQAWSYSRHPYRLEGNEVLPIPIPGYQNGYARAINLAGEIVGVAYEGGTPSKAAAFSFDGSVTTFLPGGGWWSSAHDVNDEGLVVGEATMAENNYWMVAVLWKDGAIEALPAFAGNNVRSGACAVNDAGVVVGWSDDPASSAFTTAVMWKDGEIHDLGVPGERDAEARGVNEAEQVVGRFRHEVGPEWQAFLWEDGQMQRLDDLIDPNAGWKLRHAWAINEKGWIVGSGVHAGYDRVPYLLIPTGQAP